MTGLPAPSDPGIFYQQLLSAAVSRGSAQDWYTLGCFLHDQRKWGAAAGCFARAAELDSGDYKARCNLGWNQHLAGRSDEGLSAVAAAVSAAPHEATPWALYSQIACALGLSASAIRAGREAVGVGGDDPINRMAHSFALMSGGKWAEGWREYEARFSYKLPEFLTRPYPLWRGEGVEHLFLEAEQGLGDAIMGLRWVAPALERVGRITLLVHKEVYSLAQHLRGVDCGRVRVLPLPQPLPIADAWCPLLSLPIALDEAEPQGKSYIVAPGGRQGRTGRVGIVWAGSPTHEQAHHRDCPLAYWLRLSEIPGVELHSLQVGEAAGQIAELAAYGLIHDRAPEMSNMLDTARVICGLDLVISVDTSVAHLAGALGQPVWMLVNQRGRDFRWGHEGETTGWYDSMRLFRRALDEDWGAVMGRVATGLARVSNDQLRKGLETSSMAT